MLMNEIYLFKKRLIHEFFPLSKLHACLTILDMYGYVFELNIKRMCLEWVPWLWPHHKPAVWS